MLETVTHAYVKLIFTFIVYIKLVISTYFYKTSYVYYKKLLKLLLYIYHLIGQFILFSISCLNQ